MKKIKFVVLFLLFAGFCIYRVFFVRIMYNAYENAKVEYEDQNVYIKSSFFPGYDYEHINLFFVHYRNRYYFDFYIKSKSGNIVTAEIIDDEILRNGYSDVFVDAKSWKRNGTPMIFMNLSELSNTSFSSKYNRRDEYIETFTKTKIINFKHEEYPETISYNIYFEIPINYKKNKTVELNLKYKLTFEDGHIEIVEQNLGGKRSRYIN